MKFTFGTALKKCKKSMIFLTFSLISFFAFLELANSLYNYIAKNYRLKVFSALVIILSFSGSSYGQLLDFYSDLTPVGDPAENLIINGHFDDPGVSLSWSSPCPGNSAMGAMYADALGNVYGAGNTGGFYQFDTSTGASTLVSEAPGSFNNDGAMCINSILTFDADIQVTKTDGNEIYSPGTDVVYTIVVTNAGPFGAANVHVEDPLIPGIPEANHSYTAEVSGDATTTVSGTQTGAIDDLVNLPVGGTVTYTLTVSVPSDFTGPLTNTVTATPPANIDDPDLDNNTATDTTGFYLTLSAALLLFLPPVISAQNALSCYSSRITSKSDLIDTFWKMSKDSVPAGVLSTGNKKPDNVLRKKWIVNNLEKLKVFNPDKNTSVIQSREVDIEDFYQLSYRITSDEGFIVFGNGDWVYLRVHSSHEKEEIGDISMAIDNWGKLYLNLGHVCGGIIHYVTHKKLKVQSVDDFIQNFKSDTDDRPWILIDDYYNNFTYEKFN